MKKLLILGALFLSSCTSMCDNPYIKELVAIHPEDVNLSCMQMLYSINVATNEKIKLYHAYVEPNTYSNTTFCRLDTVEKSRRNIYNLRQRIDHLKSLYYLKGCDPQAMIAAMQNLQKSNDLSAKDKVFLDETFNIINKAQAATEFVTDSKVVASTLRTGRTKHDELPEKGEARSSESSIFSTDFLEVEKKPVAKKAAPKGNKINTVSVINKDVEVATSKEAKKIIDIRPPQK